MRLLKILNYFFAETNLNIFSIFSVGQETVRSQMMAFFSFTQVTTNHSPGFRPFGGSHFDGTGKYFCIFISTVFKYLKMNV